MTRIGVAGAGAWGLALASAVQRAGSTPVIWSRRGDFDAGGMTVTGDPHLLADIDMLLLAVSAQETAAVGHSLARILPHRCR